MIALAVVKNGPKRLFVEIPVPTEGQDPINSPKLVEAVAKFDEPFLSEIVLFEEDNWGVYLASLHDGTSSSRWRRFQNVKLLRGILGPLKGS